ncbi:hypothetical protein LTR94_033176, partial [Friedmanniomyces endolithicus]
LARARDHQRRLGHDRDRRQGDFRRRRLRLRPDNPGRDVRRRHERQNGHAQHQAGRRAERDRVAFARRPVELPGVGRVQRHRLEQLQFRRLFRCRNRLDHVDIRHHRRGQHDRAGPRGQRRFLRRAQRRLDLGGVVHACRREHDPDELQRRR